MSLALPLAACPPAVMNHHFVNRGDAPIRVHYIVHHDDRNDYRVSDVPPGGTWYVESFDPGVVSWIATDRQNRTLAAGTLPWQEVRHATELRPEPPPHVRPHVWRALAELRPGMGVEEVRQLLPEARQWRERPDAWLLEYGGLTVRFSRHDEVITWSVRY